VRRRHELAVALAGPIRVAREEFKQAVRREKRWREVNAGRCSVAAPRPLFGSFADRGTNWVQNDVAAELEKGRFTGLTLGIEVLLEDVVATPIALIRGSRVSTQELLHPCRKASIAKPESEMEVVRHQAIRKTRPVVTCCNTTEPAQEHQSIGVVAEDWSLAIAASSNVVDLARDLLSRWARHSRDGTPRVDEAEDDVTASWRLAEGDTEAHRYGGI